MPSTRAKAPDRSLPSTTATGNALERRVKIYYEALGYKVLHNVDLGHHQVDLLATKYFAGGVTMTIMVECKHRADVVGIRDVTEFLRTAEHLLQTHRINCAVMVTDGAYSKEANGAGLDSAAIKLLTLTQLEQELFNSHESLIRVIRDYEARDISREYVPLRGLNNIGHTAEILQQIDAWIPSRQPPLVLIGDFGSGKTTVLEHLHYRFARRRVDDVHAPFPVLLRLRSFRRYPDLWSFIDASVRESQYLIAPRRVFEAELAAGRLLLLLDGFDEIHTGASGPERGRYLGQLAPLLNSPSRCVLSTRPTYFESYWEMVGAFRGALDDAPPLHRIHTRGIDVPRLLSKLDLQGSAGTAPQDLLNFLKILHLDRAQILERLKKDAGAILARTGMSVERFQEFLFGIYDIEDLMRRPLLLKMIIETALSADVDFCSERTLHGPSSLYELYTQMCARRDVKRAPDSQYLTESARLQACRSIALAMFRAERVQLTEREVRDVISSTPLDRIESPHGMQYLALERALTDVRLCSFLKFEQDGSLAFAHKSYLEFFVAQHGYLLSKSNLAAFAEYAAWPLGREHCYFLGSFARDQEDFGKLLQLQLRATWPGPYRDFLLRVLFASGALLAKTTLSQGQLYDVDLCRVTLTGTTLRELVMRTVTMRDITANEWTVDVQLSCCKISKASFVDCQLDIDGHDYELQDINLQKTELSVAGEQWLLSSVEMKHGTLAVHGSGCLMDVQLLDASVLTLNHTALLGNGTHIKASDCTLVGLSTEPWMEGDVRIVARNCLLAGVWLTLHDLQWKRRFTFVDCRGVVILQAEGRSKLDAQVQASLQLQYPDITFIDADALRLDLSHEQEQRVDHMRAAINGPHPSESLNKLLRQLASYQVLHHFTDSYLASYT